MLCPPGLCAAHQRSSTLAAAVGPAAALRGICCAWFLLMLPRLPLLCCCLVPPRCHVHTALCLLPARTLYHHSWRPCARVVLLLSGCAASIPCLFNLCKLLMLTREAGWLDGACVAAPLACGGLGHPAAPTGPSQSTESCWPCLGRPGSCPLHGVALRGALSVRWGGTLRVACLHACTCGRARSSSPCGCSKQRVGGEGQAWLRRGAGCPPAHHGSSSSSSSCPPRSLPSSPCTAGSKRRLESSLSPEEVRRDRLAIQP